MGFSLVVREYLPWNKVDEYWTRRKEIATSNSYEQLEEIIRLNNMTVGSDIGQVKIIER